MFRRNLLKGAAAAGLSVAAPHVSGALSPRSLKFVPTSDLAVLDPVFSPARPTRNHGYMVFDTLYGLDESFTAQPQMVDGHVVENDGRLWTLKLREGLRFHDNEPVLARDVVPSIQRFAARNGLAAALIAATAELSAPDDRTVRFRLHRPFPHLAAALAGRSANMPAIMPARLAGTAPSQPVTEMVGSGPYRFVAAERLSGAHTVYQRFEGYVPRDDGADGFTSGPKIAHFDRVVWVTLPDPATAAAALRRGEVDWWELPLWDLVPELTGGSGVRVIGDYGAATGVLRFNHLHAPFDNAAVRRTVLRCIDQKEAMTAVAGNDPSRWRSGIGLIGPGAHLANDAGTEVIGAPDPAEARAALKAAGYSGDPVVALAPTDIADIHSMSLTAVDQLRRAGLNVDLQEMDFGTLIRRRTSREPPKAGGWNIFFTLMDGAYNVDPYGNLVIRADGPAAFDGWPTSARIETLRAAWLDAAGADAQRRICRDLQIQLWQDVPYIPLGAYFQPTAYRSDLADIPRWFPQFYGIRRVERRWGWMPPAKCVI